MQDVPDKKDFNPLNAAEFLANRKGIQQGLRRMLMGPVSSIDNAGIHTVSQKLASTRVRMANDQHIDFHRQDIAYCIAQGFAFGDGTSTPRKVDDIRGEPFFG